MLDRFFIAVPASANTLKKHSAGDTK